MRKPKQFRLAAAAVAAAYGLGRAGPAIAAGPAQPYTWRHATILAGGFVPGIVYSPVRKGLVYARTDIGGFYRSTDAGQHWTPLTDGFGDDHGNWLGGESIVPDPVDADVVYAAAGMYSTNPAAILRSRDQGTTWQAAEVPIKMGGNEDGRGCGERLGVDPNDTRVLYFGSRYDGLWRSADAAATWQRVGSFPKLPSGTPGNWRHAGYGIGFVLFDPRSSSRGTPCKTIYAGVPQPGAPAALYRSTDAGQTWQPVPGLPAGQMAHQGALDADSSLYVTLGDKPGPNDVKAGGVFKLDTAAGTWADVTPDKPTADHGFGYTGLSLDRRHPGTLVVTTADRWFPGDDVFRTADGGRSWKPIKPTQQIDPSVSPYLKWGDPKPKEGWWMDAVAIDPFDADHVMYGTGATIYGTHDATNAMDDRPTHWAPEVTGFEETAAICLVSPTAGAHLISGMGDVCGFVHDDLAVSPKQGMMDHPISGNTDGLDFAAAKPATVVRVGDKGGTMSVDGGHTWAPFAAQLPAGRGQSVAISADGGTIVWSGRASGGHVSTDGGKAWRKVAGPPAAAEVIADRVSPTTFYALGGGSLYVSTDGAASFTAKQAGLPAHGHLVAAAGRTGDLWIAAGTDGLLHATDGGAFAKVASVASAKLVALGKPADGRGEPAVYLAGTVDGKPSIYRSDDNGASWVRLEDDAHQFGWLPDALAADPRVYGRVYLGTNGRGVLYGEPGPS